MNAQAVFRQFESVVGQRPAGNRVLNVVLAPFRAADSVAIEALKRGGYAADEAANLTLTGRPTSQCGENLLSLIRSHFATRFLFKFPAVRIQALERGIEFSPLRRISRLQPRTVRGVRPLSPRAAAAREAIGIGAFGAGTVAGAALDPSAGTSATLTAAAGPAALPAGMGLATGKALRRSGDLYANLARELAEQLEFSAPTIREGDIRRILTGKRFKPLGSMRRFVGER